MTWPGSAAQVVSYEIAMGLSFVAVFLYSGSLSTNRIVSAQTHGAAFRLFGVIWHWPSWYAVVLFPSFVIYLVTMVGETNRLPFDLPEGEGELVGGYHTEYSSLKFALLQLAEYLNVITVAGLATTLFLGGWRAPWPVSVWAGANSGWWPLLWFGTKLMILIFGFFWLRASLPRIRYDQLMSLGWKILIPVSLVWILMIAVIRVWRTRGGSTPVYIAGGAILAALLLLAWAGHAAAVRRRATSGRRRGVSGQRRAVSVRGRAASGPGPVPAPGPDAPCERPVFPVPPLDLPHYHGAGPHAARGTR